jgi:hypothetical protein
VLASGLAALATAPFAPGLDALVPRAHAQQHAQEPTIEQFKSILQNFGSFVAHQRYGEVWVPSSNVVPHGWKPYPACNWVYDRTYGWFYDDRTEWGRIVHHYGRWGFDEQMGWVWVPGRQFSPAHVAWRVSDQWVGWAPLPPDQDAQTAQAASFNNDRFWTFVQANQLGSRCEAGGGVMRSADQMRQIWPTTRLVTETRFVSGIPVFVLPPTLVVTVVDIDLVVYFPWLVVPWPHWAFGPWFVFWHWFVAGAWGPFWPVALPYAAAPPAPPPSPPIVAPPPGGGGGGGPIGRPLPRPGINPGGPVIVDQPPVFVPPIVHPIRPIVERPIRPIRPIDPGIGNGRPGRPCIMIYPPPPGCGGVGPNRPRPTHPEIGNRRPHVIPSNPIVRRPQIVPQRPIVRAPIQPAPSMVQRMPQQRTIAPRGMNSRVSGPGRGPSVAQGPRRPILR